MKYIEQQDSNRLTFERLISGESLIWDWKFFETSLRSLWEHSKILPKHWKKTLHFDNSTNDLKAFRPFKINEKVAYQKKKKTSSDHSVTSSSMAFYQTSVHQNCGRMLIYMHRSLFIRLDESVAGDQMSRQISPCVRKSESEWRWRRNIRSYQHSGWSEKLRFRDLQIVALDMASQMLFGLQLKSIYPGLYHF